MIGQNVSKKVCSDHIARLKRIEKSIEFCDLDDEYEKDKCESLLKLLSKKNNDEELKKRIIGHLPVGKYTMNTFKYSLRKYINYLEIITSNKK